MFICTVLNTFRWHSDITIKQPDELHRLKNHSRLREPSNNLSIMSCVEYECITSGMPQIKTHIVFVKKCHYLILAHCDSTNYHKQSRFVLRRIKFSTIQLLKLLSNFFKFMMDKKQLSKESFDTGKDKAKILQIWRYTSTHCHLIKSIPLNFAPVRSYEKKIHSKLVNDV